MIYVLMNATFHLSRSSLFFIRTLPFQYPEILVSIAFFKLNTGLILFELVLIVTIPALKLLGLSILLVTAVFVSLHLVFLVWFQGLELVYSIFNNLFKNKTKYATQILDSCWFVFAMVYFFNIRFRIDNWVAAQKISLLSMILLVTLVASLLAIIIILSRLKCPKEIIGHMQSNFVRPLPLRFRAKVSTLPLMAVSRFKLTWYYGIIVLVMCIFSLCYSGWRSMPQTMLFILPFVAVIWSLYADSLLKIRRLFNLYRIYPHVELAFILASLSLLLMPTLVIGLLTGNSWRPYLFGVGLSLAALILGFLFPKSQGNINETISSILTLIIAALLSILVNINSALLPVIFILVILAYYLIYKEEEPTI
ncbi:hypothetical protein [Oenococcus sicerae]|uniref:Uncharacterized protein n=1 Tax=Oenococcus sicerae TaxID=2203724 RepID=A0AAJ1RE09_9LACO|nr:hypothetical protein [Oenococcus sicerae]MDN6900191.1 hypothetical protein [Oenococcus sicerae]